MQILILKGRYWKEEMGDMFQAIIKSGKINSITLKLKIIFDLVLCTSIRELVLCLLAIRHSFYLVIYNYCMYLCMTCVWACMLQSACEGQGPTLGS